MLSPSFPRTHRRISAGAAAGVFTPRSSVGLRRHRRRALLLIRRAERPHPRDRPPPAVPDTKEVSAAAGSSHHGGVPGPRCAGSRVRPQALPRFHPSGLPSVPPLPGGDVQAPAPSPPALGRTPRVLRASLPGFPRGRRHGRGGVLLRPGQVQGVRRGGASTGFTNGFANPSPPPRRGPIGSISRRV